MQWKRNLRVALALQGHKIEPIVRVSSSNKKLPLAQTENKYSVSCSRCELNITVETSPGVPTVLNDERIYTVTCRKNRKKK